MIRRLRRRHRATWVAMAILLPILYVVAIAARRPAPVLETLPPPLAAATGTEPSP